METADISTDRDRLEAADADHGQAHVTAKMISTADVLPAKLDRAENTRSSIIYLARRRAASVVPASHRRAVMRALAGWLHRRRDRWDGNAVESSPSRRLLRALGDNVARSGRRDEGLAAYPFIDIDHSPESTDIQAADSPADAMFRYRISSGRDPEAGNRDQRNYEDDWGEIPGFAGARSDGSDNYNAEANQTRQRIEGKLLLAHGTMDDNVPPTTPAGGEQLIRANRTSICYCSPTARRQQWPYMVRRRWDYFVKNLLGPNRRDQIGRSEDEKGTRSLPFAS
jgi:hypothetical protein